jgi:hypothetical protein
MPWEQTSSASFLARHDTGDADDARRVLRSLEHMRVQLEELFPRVPDRVTVVLHDRAWALALSNPLIAAARLATEPSGRHLVAGWAGRDELHLLSPAALAAGAGRGSSGSIPGAREAGRLTAAALYARRVILESDPGLARGPGPVRIARELRWAWLMEGASRWLAGQEPHLRPAIARRLRVGRRPAFPPAPRDAPLLGASVFELLAELEGEPAVVELAARRAGGGSGHALERAFGARLVSIEGEWRSFLSGLGARDR